MASVFLVTDGEYSDYHVVAVFLSREDAITFLSGRDPDKTDMDNWCIEEYELGAPDGIQVRVVYNAEIDLDNGQICHEFVTYQKANVHLRSGRCCWYTNNGSVESYVSAEHARKLAAELRQYWLRAGKPESSDKVAGKIFEPSEAL